MVSGWIPTKYPKIKALSTKWSSLLIKWNMTYKVIPDSNFRFQRVVCISPIGKKLLSSSPKAKNPSSVTLIEVKICMCVNEYRTYTFSY